MRNISFAFTTRQFLDGSKDVTRRIGWKFLKPGDRLMGVLKSQGLRKGEKVQRLGEIEVVSVRREPLNQMILDEKYGWEELRREGFANDENILNPHSFVNHFIMCHDGSRESGEVTRIEFRRIAERAIEATGLFVMEQK